MSDYHVWVDGGRGGYVYYAEAGSGELRFPWEYVADGVAMDVPGAWGWDAHWARNGAPWVRGRREEIVERVIAALLGDKARGAEVHRVLQGVEFRFPKG